MARNLEEINKQLELLKSKLQEIHNQETSINEIKEHYFKEVDRLNKEIEDFHSPKNPLAKALSKLSHKASTIKHNIKLNNMSDAELKVEYHKYAKDMEINNRKAVTFSIFKENPEDYVILENNDNFKKLEEKFVAQSQKIQHSASKSVEKLESTISKTIEENKPLLQGLFSKVTSVGQDIKKRYEEAAKKYDEEMKAKNNPNAEKEPSNVNSQSSSTEKVVEPVSVNSEKKAVVDKNLVSKKKQKEFLTYIKNLHKMHPEGVKDFVNFEVYQNSLSSPEYGYNKSTFTRFINKYIDEVVNKVPEVPAKTSKPKRKI
jgi:hypothetical protein